MTSPGPCSPPPLTKGSGARPRRGSAHSSRAAGPRGRARHGRVSRGGSVAWRGGRPLLRPGAVCRERPQKSRRLRALHQALRLGSGRRCAPAWSRALGLGAGSGLRHPRPAGTPRPAGAAQPSPLTPAGPLREARLPNGSGGVTRGPEGRTAVGSRLSGSSLGSNRRSAVGRSGVHHLAQNQGENAAFSF